MGDDLQPLALLASGGYSLATFSCGPFGPHEISLSPQITISDMIDT
jgi:hypothetical protein